MENLTFIKKENILVFLESIKDKYDIYLPIFDKNTAVTDFASIENLKDSNCSINLDEKTKKSAKSVFFAPTENIFKFEYIKDVRKPDATEIKLTSRNNG